MACIYMVCNYGVCVSIWCIPMVCACIYIYIRFLSVVVCIVASRPVNLGPDQPESWSWMADTTVTHQPATESTDRTPISEIGGHLAESRGAILKGARGLIFGETRNASEEGGSARVRDRDRVRDQLEARGGPRDRVFII